MRPCTECPKYASCTSLCPEAEAYVNQDYVPQHEKYQNGREAIKYWPMREIDDKPRTREQSRKLKVLIIQMHRDGKTATEISQLLPISQSYASRVIRGVE